MEVSARESSVSELTAVTVGAIFVVTLFVLLKVSPQGKQTVTLAYMDFQFYIKTL